MARSHAGRKRAPILTEGHGHAVGADVFTLPGDFGMAESGRSYQQRRGSVRASLFPASSYRSTRKRGRYSSQPSPAHRGDFEKARLAEGRNVGTSSDGQRIRVGSTFLVASYTSGSKKMEAHDHRQAWRHRGDRSRDPALRRLNHCVEMILAILPVLLVSLAMAETTVADPFEDAAAAYDRGDYAAALSILRPLANAGDRRAQNGLGAMYTTGHGVPRDYAEAVKWYRKAAEQGLPVAQVNLAEMYLEGLGAPRDDVAAATWFRKSADQGNVDAQVGLAALYLTGQGVPQDYAEAAKWYRMAADQGHPRAQHNVGVAYRDGLGVPLDYVEARTWFRRSADQGFAMSQYGLGNIYLKGQGVPSDDAEAAKWFRKAADLGFAAAQNNLGFLYQEGRGLQKDLVEAFKWFSLAASQASDSETVNREAAIRSTENRESLARVMTPAQIAEAEKLVRVWKPKERRLTQNDIDRGVATAVLRRP